jgi:flagellar biosynthesis protein FlhB
VNADTRVPSSIRSLFTRRRGILVNSEVAQKIKAIAAEHGIPMVENVTLARALAREVQVGQPIKAKWFKQVAEILAAVYRLRKGAA